jgi:Transmembrane secretion effector
LPSYWLIYRLTGSAAAVGVLTVASRGPALVLSSVGGELAQRHDPRRLAYVLALLQVVRPTVLAVIAALRTPTPRSSSTRSCSRAGS